MSREQLSALEQDVQRLLLTGPSLASGDEGLTARRKWLEAAGARVPAFAKLAEQVGRVQGSAPEQQRGELLSLTTALAQVRAAQAQPRESQTAGPVPATEPVDTPLPPAVVEQTRRYLLELVNPRTGKPPTAQERLAGVREAIEHKSLRDLRLLVPAVRAVTEADALGKDLVEKGLPLFGAAAGPLLRARLKLEGNALDGLLLRGVALTEGAAALPLVREAVSKAAGPVRASGLRELVRLAPEEGIPLAKDMLTATPPPKPEPKKKPKAKKVAAKKGKAEPKGKKKPARKWTHAKEVREAAALALGASAQADTVKLLAQVAGDQEDPVAKAAVEGLAQCPSTEAFAALESLCRRHALRMKNFQYKYLRRKKGAKVTKEARVAWQKAQAERRRAWDHQRSYVEALVDAMGESVDPRGRALVHELAIKPRLAWSVLHRARQFLHKDRSPEARAFLLAGLDSSNQGYRALATQQLVHHWPEVARAELAPRFTEASVKKAATRSLLRQVLWAMRSQSSASNPAWREVLRLGMKHADTMPPAVQAAQHMGAGHFFEELCGILERSRSWVTNSAFSMLCAHKDWAATPAMLKYLGRARYVGWIQGFCDTVRAYGDPALLPALYKRLGKARSKHDKAKLKDLIKEFEAKAEAAAKKAGTTVPAAKKTAAKKSTAKKAAAKKPAAKKAAVKKTAAKKTAKKTATKKVAAKKTTTKRVAVRKAAKSA